jgi:hypothetical protein
MNTKFHVSILPTFSTSASTGGLPRTTMRQQRKTKPLPRWLESAGVNVDELAEHRGRRFVISTPGRLIYA